LPATPYLQRILKNGDRHLSLIRVNIMCNQILRQRGRNIPKTHLRPLVNPISARYFLVLTLTRTTAQHNTPSPRLFGRARHAANLFCYLAAAALAGAGQGLSRKCKTRSSESRSQRK
jgi:hypothetical protein